MCETSNETTTPRLILTVGLPHAGKSTWCRKQGYPIVCPDSIRIGMHGQPFIGQLEPLVWFHAKVMVKALFLSGHQTVILDATNTTIERRNEWISRDWCRHFAIFATSAAVCESRIRRATLGPMHEAALLGTLERMRNQWEEPSTSEGDPKEPQLPMWTTINSHSKGTK